MPFIRVDSSNISIISITSTKHRFIIPPEVDRVENEIVSQQSGHVRTIRSRFRGWEVRGKEKIGLVLSMKLEYIIDWPKSDATFAGHTHTHEAATSLNSNCMVEGLTKASQRQHSNGSSNFK